MGAFTFKEDRMGNYRIDPKKQFSNRLARWTAWFWFAYMVFVTCVMYLQPPAALYCVYMGIIVTAVMILNVWAYTKNSIYEKGVFAMLDKAKIEMNLSNTGESDQTETDPTETESDGDESEVSNG